MNELIQLKLSSLTGRKYWRSLNQLADTPEFRQWVEREFPEGASELLDSGSRRTLLKLMAAGFGLAGLTACRRPVEKILPLSRGVEGYVPGRPLHYATAVPCCGTATGLIVECNDGRPTKVEGNPRHPFSLGATNAFQQAMILDLYDPDRARQVQKQGVKSSWQEFESWWRETSAKLGDGSGLRILSTRTVSPSLDALKAEIAKKYPQSAWIEYEAVHGDRIVEGLR
ncbi:MAG: TAT-variant-translocated molybdopterin oxidoreductase, partial [Bryobacteraceae bacterium]